MVSPINLIALLPLLAALASASRSDKYDRRAQTAPLLERSYSGAHGIEARMARRAVGRQLAVHKADPSACRRRDSNYLAFFTAPAVISGTNTASGSATSKAASSTSKSSAPGATGVATTQESASASPSPDQAAAPSPSPSPSPAATQAPPPPSSGGNTGFTPNGIKAGMSAGDSYDYVKDHIGWWYDWTPNPSGHWGAPVAVPMIWGAGTADGTDYARLQEFKGISHTPAYIIGFEEPDCAAGSGSAGFDVATGVALWNSVVAPKGSAGSLLISPSMCHQADEQGWLGPFQSQISRDWDITNVHINKVDAAGIRSVLDHYWNTYGKPIWVTEFACVDDVHGFTPCTDQGQIDEYIRTAVGIFESDSRVAAYAYSNGYGLGDVWPAMKNGQLSASGQTYLSAISQYH